MRIAKFLSGVTIITLFAVSALAQSADTADLHVLVKDPNGAVVKNATVTVRNPGRSFERTNSSNTDGDYQFLLLPPGKYAVTVEAPGFGKASANDVRLTVGQIAQLPVGLQLATVSEVVNVNGEAEVIETQRTSSTTTIDQMRIDNLPINGRNYIDFTKTNSQVTRDTAPSIGAAPTSGLNFGGQRARSNLVNVDGADAVDNSVNGIRSTVSQEAVQEFQIITNSYAAEYGRASGGVVNIISRSGSNATHGDVFGYLRNRNFQAVNPFSSVPDPAYTRVQAGVTLGGAIQKDRTFYFFSYETTRRQETGFSTIGQDNFGLVPVDASRFFGAPAGAVIIQATPQQVGFLSVAPVNAGTAMYAALVGRSSGAALNRAWPAALGGSARFAVPDGATGVPALLPTSYVGLNSLRGNFPVSEGTSIYSLRLDHHFTPSQQGMLRMSVSPSTVTGIQVNAQGPAENFGQNAFSRTSIQSYRDVTGIAQHTWAMANNKVNEFRFQYARRGLLYSFSKAAGGDNVAVNIPGFAFFGREPFSIVDRTEQRYQFTDNFSWVRGNHTMKFGADFNYLPVDASFTVNFGGVYNFGSTALSSFPSSFPAFSPVQAYGLGIPQSMVQGIGDPKESFSNKPLGVFLQDSWRIKPNLTMNYGVRYDVEFTPTFPASNPLSAAAQNALGIVQGIPRDTNNVAPRIGLAWDPWKDGKTVFRASYGMFYDHPLLGLVFLSHATDGSHTPQLVFFGGSPSSACSPLNLNATNTFQGIFNSSCLPGNFGFIPQQQRFDPFASNSVFINQNYLSAGVPLSVQPFGFPEGKDFEYAYSHQASFGIEHDLGNNYSFGIAYNFNGGRHLNRPINVNPVNGEALVVNWERAVAAGAVPANTDPRLVQTCGVSAFGPFVPAALVSFFRPSGLNPSLTPAFAPCLGLASAVMSEFHLGLGVTVPFSDMVANLTTGSSVYHGLTANLKKRFSRHYEFLTSYTWSHAIDDSTDLQSPIAAQDSRHPEQERSTSTFDQRHRLVLSGVYQSGQLGGEGFWRTFFSDWTVAPLIELSSGRPFQILVGSDRNFDFGPNTDRPLVVSAGTPPNLCGDAVVASKYSPSGFLQPACFADGVIDGKASSPLTGNLGRNAGLRPATVFTDMRIARRFRIGERVTMDGIVDMFNIINRFNVGDVNTLYTSAGQPVSAFDPRQFQFALKLSW